MQKPVILSCERSDVRSGGPPVCEHNYGATAPAMLGSEFGTTTSSTNVPSPSRKDFSGSSLSMNEVLVCYDLWAGLFKCDCLLRNCENGLSGG